MISAVVLTKNEESCIKRCLNSLLFCNEIIIVDDFSTDKTVEKCQMINIKCQIYKRHLNNNFAKQRNFGLKKARGDWVLFVDADEVVPKSLKQEIIKTIKQNNKMINGYFIKREDIFLGKKMRYGETADFKLLRLARKNSGLWERPVHEVWKIKGKVGILNNSLLHYSHQTIGEFLKKINFYSSINASHLFSNRAYASLKDIILYPSTKFILNFILKRGFLDGMHGFIHASLMSLHSFLTRSKLYLLKYANKK